MLHTRRLRKLKRVKKLNRTEGQGLLHLSKDEHQALQLSPKTYLPPAASKVFIYFVISSLYQYSNDVSHFI